MFWQLIIIFNNFIKYYFTNLTFIEVFYKFKIKKLLNLLNIEGFKFNDFIKTLTFIIIILAFT